MKNKNRYYTLDILKFILSILIVFHHFQQATGIRFDTINFYGGKLYFGYCADLFFIISGFVCAIKSIDNVEFETYMINKLERLFAYTFFPTLLIVLLHLISFVYRGSFIGDIEISIWKIISNLSLTLCWYKVWDGTEINNPLWYASVLILCYALYWVIDRVSKKTKKDYVLYIIILMFVSLTLNFNKIDLPFLNGSCTRGYVDFSIGLLLNYLLKKINNKKLFTYFIILFLTCCSFAIMGYSSFYGSNDFERWLCFVFGVFPSIVAIAISFERFIPEEKFKKYKIGNLSFAMYAWHNFFIILVLFIKDMLPVIDLFISTYPLVSMLLFTIIVILFSVFFIEKCQTCKKEIKE